jgi:hypothetical protein
MRLAQVALACIPIENFFAEISSMAADIMSRRAGIPRNLAEIQGISAVLPLRAAIDVFRVIDFRQ